MGAPFGHCYVDLDHPLARAAVVTTGRASRLVVFVHGWGGSAHESWGDFDNPPRDDPWWSEADLLFVEYPSRLETVLAAADRIRQRLTDFYPLPYHLMLVQNHRAVRADIDSPYEELYLIGHSMGGLVLRRVLVDELDEWQLRGAKPGDRPPVLDAQLRLFSPASAGFFPRGRLGVAFAVVPLIERLLRTGAAFVDLQPNSEMIRNTRRRTERYDCRAGDAQALAGHLLWANPEQVVLAERYDTDPISRTVDPSAHSRKRIEHGDVCKPVHGSYDVPYLFVATGDIR